VFSGEFDENGQTVFEFDLTGKTITDGILVISSIAVPTQETFYETHSEVGKGWLNTGSWSGKYFMADYYKCYNMDCWDGETKIGPFIHYPGTPGYTGYTTWVEDNRTQYVKTSYTQLVNEYSEKTEYNLNSNGWTTITNELGSGTTSTTIPAASFAQGLNTLQFKESNTYSTKFDWVLYIDQGYTPEEYVTTYTYDTYGNMTSSTDANGNTTFYEYDSHYLYLTSVTDALNHTVQSTRDFPTGLVTSIQNAQGNTVSFEYDISGRVTKRVNLDLTEVKAVYDDFNNAVTVYDELDHYITSYYDGLNRLTKIQYFSDTEPITETYTYNYLGKQKTYTDFGGDVYTYEYDAVGRPTKMINPDATFSLIEYDNTTNTATIYDENQHKKEYHSDWVGNLIWVKEYIDAVNYYFTQYTYDSAGNLTSFTDANQNTTHYRYNSLFGVTSVLYPDLTEETFVYDAAGNCVQKTDFNGSTVLTYNALYQLIEAVNPDSTSVTYAYDENGNCITMTDSTGSTVYTYDTRNRLTSETRTIEGVPYPVSYQYDAASRLVSLEYPDHTTITYEYDDLNRLTTIPGYAEFTYNTDSLLSKMVYNNGTITDFYYDTRNRPVTLHTEKNDTDILLMNYHYDPVGNITQADFNRRSDQQWIQSTEIFQYDSLDRVVSAEGDYGLLEYSYDSVGNRISLNTLFYSYNSMNELISISDGTAFTYDGNGNTITKTDGINTWSYTYDTKNLLIQVEKNQQVIAHYEYDGNGYRIKKTEWVESVQDYQTIIYIYSGSAVIYEKNLTTEKEASYIHGPAGLLCKNVNGLTDYYHTDHLGSTRLITDESGNPVTDIQYTPFGETITQEEERFLYTGKEKDATGLYYYGARYYDPAMGRFLTRDPVTGKTYNPQSLNRYIYCLNNPLKYVDPAGLSEEEVIIDFYDTTHPKIYVSNWEGFLRKLRQLWTQRGYSASKIRELLIEYISRFIQKIVDSYGMGLTEPVTQSLIELMAFLEAVVHVFGDALGITGAFFVLKVWVRWDWG
ncbi:MAG: RHS repeat-associated core domain-containing protein, partial [Candidatus Methanofastidiosia archaeon]